MNDAAASLIGATVLLLCGAAIIIKGRRPPPTAQPGTAAPISSRPAELRPAGQQKILAANELLDVTGTQGLVEVIRNRLALTDQNWLSDGATVLERYCEFVQLLPASESHHHAQPGGLLIHTLEVTSYALTIRQGYKLPAGASPEDQVKKQAIWSYELMLAALLHDIGKPVSDVLVQLYGSDPKVPLGHWQALSGSMLQTAGTHYEVDFPDSSKRDYKAHQRLGVVLLHAIVPTATMRWLSTDPQLLPALIAFLDGQQDVPGAKDFKDIIQKADSLSVSDNLLNGPRTRYSKARQTPLIERLMWGLRTLLAEGQLSLNRPGATLFFDPDGLHFWAVSATLAEKVRAVLDEREIRQSGAAAIPKDNTRLFDTWHEYGALVAPTKEHGKGSVWWVRIDLPEWTQVLTVLKFRISDTYSGQSVPQALPGTITPVAPNHSSAKGTAGAAAGSEDTPAGGISSGVTASEEDTQVLDQSHTLPADQASSPALSAVEAGDAIIEQMLAGYDNASASSSPAAAAQNHKADEDFLDSNDSAGAVILQVKPPVQALTIPKSPPTPKNRAYGAQSRPDADAFFAWIQQGLGTGDISYNESDSVVHFTAEGMAIVSPRAFKIYLESHPYKSDLGQSKNALNAIQKDVQRGGYIQRNTKLKTSFHIYLVKAPDGTLSGGRLTTYIVPNPQAYIRPVPSPNPALVLDTQSENSDDNKVSD
ncbi:hypothetical protein B9Z51_06770 [Limnohabitans sp. T6-5]|uniref:MobH family relaxase n=1 Tax=Limnohabitans sp. T6-5 TaxID=1100724 RepID=UPI000D3A14EC|nr:MobH family relaxase [Limnohabitans sp. T6-5]PUE08647.1 hypothetical protein B9Z51_06770 [Limnohabitans sp. T6-5]